MFDKEKAKTIAERRKDEKLLVKKIRKDIKKLAEKYDDEEKVQLIKCLSGLIKSPLFTPTEAVGTLEFLKKEIWENVDRFSKNLSAIKMNKLLNSNKFQMLDSFKSLKQKKKGDKKQCQLGLDYKPKCEDCALYG